ncbi:MAG: hypothetical protein RIR18_1584 [Pseudomonadota bacterium]|jgi:hypothetical protein
MLKKIVGISIGRCGLLAMILGLGLSNPLMLACAEEEMADAKFQTTFNWQRHPSFRANYSGTNSLTNAAENMYTFSTTGHIGIRPWQGGELYYNGEVVEGVPFTRNLVGMGGFTNGEITRAAGETPKYYNQRFFLRQTWNQGGGTESVTSDFNQLAGMVDKNRFVLTVGNFSTLDVFDDNTYAKDPRTQFMNWGNWTYAAYDYAADARGFGWGFAAEWYQDDWTYRIGRMTGPVRPNEQQTDFQIGKHYGDQIEIERAHTLNERPGKLRVLFWRNKANLARFDDALSYRLANPGADAETIFQVRNAEQFKVGLGVNIEQEISDNVGFFMRAMKVDGQTETYAFTEVDESLSTGVLLKGKAWHRENDAVGLAFLSNGLSKERRQFLQAGGMSYFIGDGALNYRPETIVEGFYSWQAAKGFWITGDYQRVWNPAYNADRGPVNIFAVRLHAEY